MNLGAVARVAGRALGRGTEAVVDARQLDQYLNMSSMEVRGATQAPPDISVRAGEVARLDRPSPFEDIVEGGLDAAPALESSGFEKYIMDDSLFTSPPVPEEAATNLNTSIEAAAKTTKIEGMASQIDDYGDAGATINSDIPGIMGTSGATANLASRGGNNYSLDIGLDKSLRGTGEGSVTYQGVYAWAAKNGKVIVPDETGLSAANYIRKSAQVASSFIKEGKSAHIVPDPQVFAFAMNGVETTKDINDIAELSNALVKYSGKEGDDYSLAKQNVKGLLDEFYPKGTKVSKDFDKFADDYADTYKTYYNPDVQDSPQVAAQRANNLLVANMAASAKVAFGGKEVSSIGKAAVSSKNKAAAIEFTSDHNVKDPNNFDWKKFMVPVGSDTSNLPFLSWLGKAAIEGRLGKGTLPAVAGAAVATKLYEDEGALQ